MFGFLSSKKKISASQQERLALMNCSSMNEYEDALANILLRTFDEQLQGFEADMQAINPSPTESLRITTESILFPLSYANMYAKDKMHFKMQAGLVIANEIYIRTLTKEDNYFELNDCVLSQTEREEYQAEIRKTWSAGNSDLSKPNYRTLLRVMVPNGAARCGDDITRGSRSSPNPRGQETIRYVAGAWGNTFTDRTLGSEYKNTQRHRTCFGHSSARLLRVFFFLNDRLG
jgi:hypothetical protein